MAKLYREKDFTKKLELFFKTLKIDKNLQNYIKIRIKKFNKTLPITIADKTKSKNDLYRQAAEIEKSFLEGKIKKETAKKYLNEALSKKDHTQKTLDEIITKDDIKGIETEISEIGEN
jgi:hypothetical protein